MSKSREISGASPRAIKFRAWDEREKCWLGAFCIHKTGLIAENPIPDNPTDDVWTELRESDYILMQYTGLKDKNGVEIYEGDICQQETSSCKWVGFVAYKAPEFIVQGNNVWDSLSYGEYEVIGNIHENPEIKK